MGNFHSILFPYPKPPFYGKDFRPLYWIPDENEKRRTPVGFYGNKISPSN
jgi:hypothetical protein